MATLTKGVTISDTTTVTSQILHDLIELAIIGNVTVADISGNVTLIYTQASVAPDPSLYPFWYDSFPEDPVFRVWDSLHSIWLVAGPHRFEFPMQNMSATNLRMGTLVVQDPKVQWGFNIATAPSLNVVGFLQNSCASGAWGAICNMGVGWGLWISAVSNTHVLAAPGCPIISRHVIAGGMHYDTAGIGVATNLSGPNFGLSLDGSRSGTSQSFSKHRIRIWPARLRLTGW